MPLHIAHSSLNNKTIPRITISHEKPTIFRILLNLEFLYIFKKEPVASAILCQINAVHSFPSYFINVCSNIIYLQSSLFRLGFPNNYSYVFLYFPVEVICAEHPTLLD